MPNILTPEYWRGWRKIICFHSALVAVTWLGLAGKMDSSALSFTISALITAVVAGNAAVHIAGKAGNEGVRVEGSHTLSTNGGDG